MDFLKFHKRWRELGCFSIHQLYAWQRNFNRTNLNYWIKKGYIVKLRNGWYAFSDCLTIPDFNQYVANRIYRPSYISLHSALAHYGMIPEEILTITSVSPLKTMDFSNAFGEYAYKSVKSTLMFGYEPKLMRDGRAIFFATPEKALLDLLYLYPFYTSDQDMLDLRLDEDFMHDDFNLPLFLEYTAKFNSGSLLSRVKTLIKAYDL